MNKIFTLLILGPILLTNPQSWAIPAEGSHLMMAGPSPYAIEVGQKIAEQGGNVIDVAVAMGFTLAVTSPYFAGLGGGGFALVKFNGKVHVLDFRETAPAATHPKYYLKLPENASKVGGAAVGVPGWPAGLYALHKKFGKLPWAKLLKRPTKMAKKGFRVSGAWTQRVERANKKFTDSARKHFLKSDQSLYLPGEVFKQKALAQVLKEMKTKNIKSFYSGQVANDIVASVKKAGGQLSLADMKSYKVRWLEPMQAKFGDHKLFLMPPPSSGGVVIKSAFRLIEKLQLQKQKPLSVSELHLMGEILSRSFRGRSLLGDPEYYKNPLSRILSEAYLDKMAKSISLKKSKALPPLADNRAKESNETTHYSVMDKKGNAVSLTVTLNGNFGSGVVSDKFGIALNNEMDDFTTRPGEPNMYGLIQGQGNFVEPGKRPLSSMSPTIVEKNGKTIMAIGAPGGPRIISGVIQTIYRVLVSKMDMDMAIQAPRVHHQFLPNKLYVDEKRFAPESLDGLRKRGHVVEESWHSRVYGVRVNERGYLEAAYDSRTEGAAGGY